MLIKLDDAIAAVKAIEVPVGGFEDKIDAWLKAIDISAAALRALPVSDGWEDIASLKAENERLLVEINAYKDAIAQAEGIIAELRADNHSPRTRWG